MLKFNELLKSNRSKIFDSLSNESRDKTSKITCFLLDRYLIFSGNCEK